jgi:hypothetical protein
LTKNPKWDNLGLMTDQHWEESLTLMGQQSHCFALMTNQHLENCALMTDQQLHNFVVGKKLHHNCVEMKKFLKK